MSEYNSKCGPNAIDYYDRYTHWGNGTYSRSHVINGTGAVTKCEVLNYSNYSDSYTISDGITELADGCFNKSTINSVSLPQTLHVIGDNCFAASKISYLDLPSSLLKIGHNNFPRTLKKLNIPQNIKEFFLDNVINCGDLYEITVDEGNKIYIAKDGVLYNYDMTEILFCPNGKTGKIIIPNSVKRIGDYCFANCQNLDMIIIPTSVVEIGDYAFQSCSRLREVRIPDGVANIGDNTFKYCTHLEKVTLPDSVNCIGEYAFSRCNNLTELIIPASVKRIGDGAFYGCDKLADRAGYVIIRQVLYSYCGTERDIVIPEGVVRISTEAFFFRSLRTVTIPSSVTEIGNLAFMSWPDLSIHAPEGSCAEQYAKEKNISFVAE